MTEQLALFDLPPALVIRSSFSDSEVDTKGYDPSWDDPLPKSSTEKTDESGKFNCGDRVAIAGGDRIGTTGTVIDVNDRWVSVEFDAGKTEVLPEVELVPGQESIETTFNPSGLSISFGQIPPQLLSGQKTVTRRQWKDVHAQKFIRAWEQGLSVRALDKDFRYGGKQIGWLRLTCCPYQELLEDMPESDVALEGFPELSKSEFIDHFFGGNHNQPVWVVRFKALLEDQVTEPADLDQHRSPEEPIRRSKTRNQVSGWIEFEEKFYEGKRKTSTYRYFYYRYEVWRDGKLLRTPAKRLSMSQLELVSRCLEESFSVDEILERLKHHADSVIKHRCADSGDTHDSSWLLDRCDDRMLSQKFAARSPHRSPFLQH